MAFNVSWAATVSRILKEKQELSAAVIAARISKTRNRAEVMTPRQIREQKYKAEITRKLETLVKAIKNFSSFTTIILLKSQLESKLLLHLWATLPS